MWEGACQGRKTRKGVCYLEELEGESQEGYYETEDYYKDVFFQKKKLNDNTTKYITNENGVFLI